MVSLFFPTAIHDKFEYLCELSNITFIEQEESYTSKASFFDYDFIPTYGDSDVDTIWFSGKRVKRGLYRTVTGYEFNADVNGALNIMRKSKAVDLTVLCCRGAVSTPARIKILDEAAAS